MWLICHISVINWRSRFANVSKYDIEIYVVIDIYSRYVIWLYVEIFALTQINVLRQFLNVFFIIKHESRFVRSNRDIKIIRLIDTHYYLKRAYDSKLIFINCYMYDINISNQRIEFWWQQMNRKFLNRYKIYQRTIYYETIN